MCLLLEEHRNHSLATSLWTWQVIIATRSSSSVTRRNGILYVRRYSKLATTLLFSLPSINEWAMGCISFLLTRKLTCHPHLVIDDILCTNLTSCRMCILKVRRASIEIGVEVASLIFHFPSGSLRLRYAWLWLVEEMSKKLSYLQPTFWWLMVTR